MQLHAKVITALSIHYSALVNEEYSLQLQEIMIQVYEEEMGYGTVLKVS